MTALDIPRPGPDEYAPYYAGYMARVPDAPLLTQLVRQGDEMATLLAGIDERRAGYRYAPEKWSIKEMVGHLTDVEWIMAYRLLRIARADPTPLVSFSENDYVRAGQFDRLPLATLAAQLARVRQATVGMLGGLTPDALARRGEANGAAVSARAIAYIVAGHELHHVQVLQSRYLRFE